MPLNTCEYQLLFLICFLLKSCHAFRNDGTEVFSGHMVSSSSSSDETPNNASLNRARNGGRRADTRDPTEQHQVGCRELRSTKYISDGQCTSLNPVKELVCAGECLPTHLLPNWIGGGLYWSRRDAQEWRCVTDRTRTQRIKLQCQDGSTRTYKITAVTSCKCKRYMRQHNESTHASESPSKEHSLQDPGKKKSKNKNAKLKPKN
ncbi:sclerostin domain-containing protein 1-like [Myxocyprinus asiaticus]|uniref:sclerostin domain-containing protein 1-like n=1 Tax=Myxocyprinus asiaticus TaxID=70543 RepID=UPI00222287DF|nr:sclerostin domain-containing protein 1-like [Myxocyprinus asiaticus]